VKAARAATLCSIIVDTSLATNPIGRGTLRSLAVANLEIDPAPRRCLDGRRSDRFDAASP
jgi:hypothetical protein